MGVNKPIAGLPVGTFIVNFYDQELDEREREPYTGWEVAEITGARPAQLFSCSREEGFDGGGDMTWAKVNPLWNLAVLEGHPAHELLCALKAVLALGGKYDDLLARVEELCNKELRNEAI